MSRFCEFRNGERSREIGLSVTAVFGNPNDSKENMLAIDVRDPIGESRAGKGNENLPI